jgi:hypothetical protein
LIPAMPCIVRRISFSFISYLVRSADLASCTAIAAHDDRPVTANGNSFPGAVTHDYRQRLQKWGTEMPQRLAVS